MSKPSSPQAPGAEKFPSVQADLLGETTPLQPPASPAEHQPGLTADTTNTIKPQPAHDENQPGFIGERNLPNP